MKAKRTAVRSSLSPPASPNSCNPEGKLTANGRAPALQEDEGAADAQRGKDRGAVVARDRGGSRLPLVFAIIVFAVFAISVRLVVDFLGEPVT